MRILVIHEYFLSSCDSGGSRFNQFAKYWRQAGHEVTILTGMICHNTHLKYPECKGKLLIEDKDPSGATVYRCHVSEAYNKSFLGRFWAYLSFAISSFWAGINRAPKPDVIVATSPPLTVAITMWLLSVYHGVPAIFEVRDLWPESAIDTGVLASKPLIWLSYRLEELAYRRASWINVLTPAFKKKLIDGKGVPANRISMIPNGADLDIMKPGPKNNKIRKELGLDGKFVVSYFGAHGRANRVGQLLDVAERIKLPHPDVRIMLVGSGMEKQMLVEDAQRRSLDNVVFVDAVPKSEVVDYINASDVCTAVLMKNDTFKTVYPNKVFDYMCCRRPIIIAIDGAARKLVADAGAGVYAEPENPDAFIDALLGLRANPDEAQQMGRRGLAFVQKSFSRESFAEKYAELLETFCPKPA